MCTVLLPPGVNPIAVNKYIISYIIYITYCFQGYNYLKACASALYTGCPRRNVPDFGRVFLMLKYTDITQNTYVKIWTGTEIKAREKCGLLAVPRTLSGSHEVIHIRCSLSVLVYSRLKRVSRFDCICKGLGNPKNNYDMRASVFLVQFNDFMSLTS